MGILREWRYCSECRHLYFHPTIIVLEIEFNSFPKWFSGCVIAVTESPENLSPLSRRPAGHQKWWQTLTISMAEVIIKPPVINSHILHKTVLTFCPNGHENNDVPDKRWENELTSTSNPSRKAWTKSAAFWMAPISWVSFEVYDMRYHISITLHSTRTILDGIVNHWVGYRYHKAKKYSLEISDKTSNKKSFIRYVIKSNNLTLISTFLALKLKRIWSFNCSTIGVKIFIQLSFKGVYLCGGTGIFLVSVFPPYEGKSDDLY